MLPPVIMPAEWAPHERTLMAWPRRREIWGPVLEDAKRETAGVANAVAAFEPLTMVAGSPEDAREARAALTGGVEVLELPIDDSWLRDSGPIFVVDDPERPARRAAVHWGFNAWGGKFPPWERDAEIGGVLGERLAGEVLRGPMVLEGGAIAVDGAGRLLTTEQCLLHPNRNPDLGREEIEGHLRELLGVRDIIWLGDGLAEDRDTDGHVDLIAAFTAPGRVLMQSTEPGNPNHEPMAANRERALAAGLEVDDFPLLAYATVNGEEIAASYLNFYVGNGFLVVPVSGEADRDEEALRLIAGAYPGREAVGTPGLTLAYGGGGPHCITQQVPSVEPRR
jgi:agmatine deiminase